MRGRRDKIVASLPTVLDLLTLSVEAGMSFDGAACSGSSGACTAR